MAPMQNQVSVNASASLLGPKKVFTLPVEEIHPIVRMAHRRPLKTLTVERVTFDHEFVLFLDGHGTFFIDKKPFEIGRTNSSLFARNHPDSFILEQPQDV
jgi:hypothetical protein